MIKKMFLFNFANNFAFFKPLISPTCYNTFGILKISYSCSSEMEEVRLFELSSPRE